jgi:hypothetical protein
MGLAREALRDLLTHKGISQLATNIRPPVTEHEEIANEAGLRRIFDSVNAEIMPLAGAPLSPPTAPQNPADISIVHQE